MQDTKEPAPEPEGITTFTFFEGVERGDANPNALYARGDATQVTEAELREYFNAQGSQMLKRAFGDFDNYLAYMTEREQLIQSGDYDVGNWDEATGGLTEDELMILEGEDLTQYTDSDQDVYTEAYGERMQEQSAAYDNWANSEANQALLAKYGVDGTMYNSDGDTFKWNGSAYVKTNKVDDSINIGDIAKLGFAIALSVVGTPAIANALAPNAIAGSSAALAANATASSIMNVATQLLTTGQIDPEGALRAAATSFLSNTAMNALRESGVFGQIGDAVNTTTTDQLVSANGDVLGQVVRDAAGNIIESTGVDPSVWFALASETGAIIQEGQSIVSQIASVLPDVPEWLYDAAQTTVDAVDQLFEDTRKSAGATISGDLNFEPSDVSFIDQLREAIEREEDPEVRESLEQELSRYEEDVGQVGEVPPEEDIFADTTQEATGLEAGSIIEDLFNDYMEEFRQEFEGQQNITIEQVQEVVANALGGIEQPETLTQEQVQQIVNDAVSSIPQADTLSEEQVQEIVNNAVSAIEIPEGITTEEVSNIVNEAIAGIPAGTSPEQVQEIVNQAISGIDIPEGMTPEQVQQIVDTAVSGIEFPEGISTEDVDQIVSEAIRNIEFPEVDTLSNEEVQSIVDTAIGNIEFPEGVTAEQVQEIVQQQIANVPEGLTQDEVSDIVSQAIAGIQFPEGITAQDVQGIVDQAVSNIQFPEAVSTEQVQDIVDAAVAGIDIPEGISEEQVGNIVDTAIANIEFPEGVTQEQVNQIVNQAIGDIQFPEGVTQSQVTEIVNQAIAGIEFPEVDTLSTDEVQSIVNTAISGIEFPEGVTADQVLDIIQAQLEAQPEGLTSDDVNQIVSTAIGNIQFPASVTQEEVTDLLGEVEDTLSSSLESYQAGVQEELEAAEEERAVLGGQLGTLTTEVADIAEDLIGVGGDIEDLDERTQERLDELGLDLEDLGLLVNVNFEALQQGMLTQESAMQELIEETTRQTEESLTERLAGRRRLCNQSV